MLDCKMNTSLSPVTPVNIHHESYMAMWEQESQAPKLINDMMEMLEGGGGGEGGTNSPTTTIHHHQNRGDCHFQSSHSQYLSALGDPYSPAECHILEGFHCPTSNNDTKFHNNLPENPTNFPENNYDSFMPDYNAAPHHHSNSMSQGLAVGEQCGPSCLCPSSSSASFINHQLTLSAESSMAVLCHPSNSSQPEYNWTEDLNCDPAGEYMFLPKGDSPNTSDSISYTDIDSEMDSNYSKSSGGSLSVLTEICTVSPPKRKVGRPPKKDKKMKRNEKKTGRLWEFIRDLLKNPEYCPSLIRWDNADEGHFRFVNSEKVAQLWGQIKGNPRMTYEKLSRAMRYYYKSHVFEPVLGRRLVYKFGHNATNWKPVNPNFASIQKLYTN